MTDIANQPVNKKTVKSSLNNTNSAKTKRKAAKNNLEQHRHLSWKRILKWVAIIFLTLGIGGFLAGAAVFVSYASSAPKFNISELQSQPNTIILDNQGKTVAELGSEQRINISTDQIPMQMVNAITSIEDHTFFSNRGIDPVRIVSSAVHIANGGSLQGGSTISQELIKLSYFSTAESDQTLKRKAQEAWLSIEMNKELSKDEILTLYINKVYMSNGYYGMQTASENFYQKPMKDLTLAQTALLAGMPQAPNSYNPYTNPTSAKWRRDLVLEAMYKYGKITKSQETAAINTPVTDGLKTLPPMTSIPAYLNNYVTEVISQVQSETGKDPATTSMKIYTPLDNGAQQRLYDIYNTDQYVNYPNDKIQVASTLVDVNTGAVVAQLGGRKQPDVALGFNQATSTDRDWGSSNKPITDYGPAIEDGIYKTTGATVLDAPYDYPGTNTAINDWDGAFDGNISIQYALWQSRNVPAVKTLAAVGLNNSLAFLNKLGIQYPQLEYSNAISSMTSSNNPKYGVSSEKMAAAYAAFANGGTYHAPYYVSKVVYSDGSSKTFTTASDQAMKATTAYMITDMLKGVIPNGTNGPTFPPNQLTQAGLKQAGKTGTSNYSDNEIAQAEANAGMYGGDPLDNIEIAPDEAFVGYTTKYAMAVWTGYTNRLVPLNYADAMLSGSVYTQMFKYLYPNPSSSSDWTMPSGIFRGSGGYLYENGTSQSDVAPTAPTYSGSYSYNGNASSSSGSSTSSSSTSASSSATLPSDSATAPSSSATVPSSSSTATLPSNSTGQ